ncbi:MAG TPA: DUF1223 domain-containing protein [Pyrinomonadaceae bacterium]|nr:DUF1223 domain-containing protein [Pyrinomonadaceae bacterium]
MKKLIAAVLLGLGIVGVAASVLVGHKAREAAAPAVARGPGAASGDAEARTPVLVELFTSEGCSSCPPADQVLARLSAAQPVAGAEVIPLAFHVDYWNYLGWADPFSSAQFSGRQGEYARAYGKEGVYTPQMIVDGVREFPGGNRGLADEAIAAAAKSRKSPVYFDRGRAGAAGEVALGVRVEELPKTAAGEAAFVLLAVTEGGLTTDVRRGENAGRRLAHAGVVRRLTTLGPVPAAGGRFEARATVAVEKNWRRENLRAVVFAQERGSRRVLAAGSIKLFD